MPGTKYIKEKVIRDIEMVIGKKDTEYLHKLFDSNNQNYFGNKLTKPVFKFYTGKDLYGRCIVGSRDGKVPTEIWISKYAHDTHENLEDTVLHEMIHQFIYEVLHGPKYQIITHGVVFRSVCFYLRCKYGVKIEKPASIF